jgi:hypothetical protein
MIGGRFTVSLLWRILLRRWSKGSHCRRQASGMSVQSNMGYIEEKAKAGDEVMQALSAEVKNGLGKGPVGESKRWSLHLYQSDRNLILMELRQNPLLSGYHMQHIHLLSI